MALSCGFRKHFVFFLVHDCYVLFCRLCQWTPPNGMRHAAVKIDNRQHYRIKTLTKNCLLIQFALIFFLQIPKLPSKNIYLACLPGVAEGSPSPARFLAAAVRLGSGLAFALPFAPGFGALVAAFRSFVASLGARVMETIGKNRGSCWWGRSCIRII